MLTETEPISTGSTGQNQNDPVSALLDAAPPVGETLPCRREPDLWFAERPRELEQAKSLCGDCPVKADCLAGALSRGEPWGVWGGEIFDRGAVIQRKRSRGRPRKHPLPQCDTTTTGQENAA